MSDLFEFGIIFCRAVFVLPFLVVDVTRFRSNLYLSKFERFIFDISYIWNQREINRCSNIDKLIPFICEK